MRFIAWGAISMAILDPIIEKVIKKIFGGHYDEFKEEEHLENKKAQKKFLKQDLNQRLLEAQRRKIESLQKQLLNRKLRKVRCICKLRGKY